MGSGLGRQLTNGQPQLNCITIYVYREHNIGCEGYVYCIQCITF